MCVCQVGRFCGDKLFRERVPRGANWPALVEGHTQSPASVCVYFSLGSHLRSACCIIVCSRRRALGALGRNYKIAAACLACVSFQSLGPVNLHSGESQASYFAEARATAKQVCFKVTLLCISCHKRTELHDQRWCFLYLRLIMLRHRYLY